MLMFFGNSNAFIPTPLPQFIINATFNDFDIRLPNPVDNNPNVTLANGAYCFVRTAAGKSCRIIGSWGGSSNRVYGLGQRSGTPILEFICDSNQNHMFLYYNQYWYAFD